MYNFNFIKYILKLFQIFLIFLLTIYISSDCLIDTNQEVVIKPTAENCANRELSEIEKNFGAVDCFISQCMSYRMVLCINVLN